MRKIVARFGTLLLFAVIAICLAPTLVPPFLDRIYYRGPVSDHFDGSRFFNPGEHGPEPAAHSGGRAGFLARFLSGSRSEWPEEVPVTPTVPRARVEDDEMVVTWIGHATVLIQTQGFNILTDPIWSERASPFSFVGPKRVRAPGVRFEDLPKIDLVLISHNHYDHLDLPTLERVWERDRPLIVTSLGNDTILGRRGIASIALDWGQSRPIPGGAVIVERNHHWGSRWGTDRNRALWSGFTIVLPGGNIFFAGDTGWSDGSWVRQAAKHGPFRLAILPIGAYEPRDFMKTNHVDPDEAVRIFEALNPQRALGIHWGTFQLTFEPINDPPQRLERAKAARGVAADRFIVTEAGRSFDVPRL